MAQAGMVDALAECRRVLTDGGLLIDLRPFAGNWPLEVVGASGGPGERGPEVWPVGPLDDSQERPDDAAANAALDWAMQAGWFRRERATTFEYAWYWDTLAELEAYIAARWTTVMRLPAPTRREVVRLLATRAPGARLRLRRGMLLGRYRRGAGRADAAGHPEEGVLGLLGVGFSIYSGHGGPRPPVHRENKIKIYEINFYFIFSMHWWRGMADLLPAPMTKTYP